MAKGCRFHFVGFCYIYFQVNLSQFSEMEPENNKMPGSVNSTISAVTGLVTAIPVYQDAVQPAAKEVGKALQTVSKLVNIALSPIAGFVWGFEKIQEWLDEKLSDKLKDVPQENVITPPIPLAAPIVNHLMITTDQGLCDAFLNLLAKASNSETVHQVHPAFVTTLSDLSSDEAVILNGLDFSKSVPAISIEIHTMKKEDPESYESSKVLYSRLVGFEKLVELVFPQNIDLYVQNLERLGIIGSNYGSQLVNRDADYQQLEDWYIEEITEVKKFAAKENEKNGRVNTVEIGRSFLRLTPFGRDFISACQSK